jgi:hypothetical protein
MKWVVAMTALVLALGAPAPARADWNPRQTRIIKAANEVLEADAFAFMNSCKVADGKARYAAGVERLKAMMPALERELGSYAVYEIFVLRAPTFAPGALPPKKCKKLKHYAPEKEAVMARFEAAVTALAASVKNP